MRIQNDPSSRWPDASLTKEQKAIQRRGTHGKAFGEGGVDNLELADVLSSHSFGRLIDPGSDVCCAIVDIIIVLESVRR
jgi:hypothetical protein